MSWLVIINSTYCRSVTLISINTINKSIAANVSWTLFELDFRFSIKALLPERDGRATWGDQGLWKIFDSQGLFTSLDKVNLLLLMQTLILHLRCSNLKVYTSTIWKLCWITNRGAGGKFDWRWTIKQLRRQNHRSYAKTSLQPYCIWVSTRAVFWQRVENGLSI